MLYSTAMTQRLYYSDSYTRQFAARVIEHLTVDGQSAVVLDRSFFYPASGGQPADRGTIGGVPVLDVTVRESDKAVLHVLERPVAESEAACELDWARRFDAMQQHTGQHILSQAFLRAANAATISFHLGGDSVTIDLDVEPARLPPAALERAEEVANRAVTGNLPVRAWFPAADELATLPLRKTPDVDGPLRVVAIGDFDFNACGGTHVAATGEVGLIKIIKTEKQKKATRIEFRCGARALADYGRKNALLTQLAADFSCGVPEVPQAVSKLRDEAQAARKDLRAAREAVMDHEAQTLLDSIPAVDGRRVIRQAYPQRDMAELRGLAARLAAAAGTVALLGAAGEKAQLVFARADDVPVDMKALLLPALAALGSGRGGGDARLAQGGGMSAPWEAVAAALQQAENELRK
ncbi:MAG: alanyl-tRNA editing protein [Chloroflexi bacterium]|nr:alanyl-tRNA editing protein [Chloroflexota bacterium]